MDTLPMPMLCDEVEDTLIVPSDSEPAESRPTVGVTAGPVVEAKPDTTESTSDDHAAHVHQLTIKL